MQAVAPRLGVSPPSAAVRTVRAPARHACAARGSRAGSRTVCAVSEPAAAVGEAGERQALPPLDSPPNKRLRDPVLLHAQAHARQPVQDVGGDGALQKYMTLPVEQYFVLDPDSVQRLGATSFRCRIPRMSFFSVWLEPEVDVDVVITATQVHMRSTSTRVFGSDFVTRSNLNESFDMFWSTTLTWGRDGGGNDGGQAHIAVETEVKVWCEVLPPFHLMPRRLLSGACNAVLRRAVPVLLSAFIRNLADDYRKWGNEPAYRALRAGLN